MKSRKEIKNRVTGLPDLFSPYSVILLALKAVKRLIFSGKADKQLGRTMKNASSSLYVEIILGLKQKYEGELLIN